MGCKGRTNREEEEEKEVEEEAEKERTPCSLLLYAGKLEIRGQQTRLKFLCDNGEADRQSWSPGLAKGDATWFRSGITSRRGLSRCSLASWSGLNLAGDS